MNNHSNGNERTALYVTGHSQAARPQLVLDAGGVLATNMSPGFWHSVAVEAKLPMEHIYRIYKSEVSHRLWTDQVTEEVFWKWLQKKAPLVEESKVKGFIADCLKPLPAVSMSGPLRRRPAKNVDQGEALGWNSLLADSEGLWISKAEMWLNANVLHPSN